MNGQRPPGGKSLATWPKVPNEVWRTMTTEERLISLSQRSLDECKEILDAPIDLVAPHPALLGGKVQVIRAILMTCTKLGVEASRSTTERERILSEMARDLRRAQELPDAGKP
jgi:hypothetical protein